MKLKFIAPPIIQKKVRKDKGTKREKPFNLKQVRRKNKMLSSDAGYYLFGAGEIKNDTVTKEHMIKIEETYCSHFGCSHKLSLIEKLAGNKCTNHMIRKVHLFHNGKL